MNRKDILDYARKTPTNTNVNVLGSMIDSVVRDSGGSGEGSSGATTTESDVTFYDYDGTVVASFTKNEWLRQTSLPANPIHEGLVAQGWNWSKSDIDSYVSKYGKCNIGQMYNTASGDTEIDIFTSTGQLEDCITFTELAEDCIIDWGDGGETSTIYAETVADLQSSSGNHVFVEPGFYTVRISGGGLYVFGDNSAPIINIRCSNHVKGFYDSAFLESRNLRTISMSNTITDISYAAFESCSNLQFIVFPNSMTNIECAFANCCSLQTVAIPKGVTHIDSGTFNGCESLKEVFLPENITSIEYGLLENIKLQTIITPMDRGYAAIPYFNYSPETLIFLEGNTTLSSCKDYYTTKTIIIPNGTEQIETTFDYCYNLRSIIIPAGITSMETGAFQYCGPYTIYAPANVVDEYKNGVFSEYADHIQPIPVE